MDSLTETSSDCPDIASQHQLPRGYMDLAEELPFAAVVSSDRLPFVCSFCFETSDDKPFNRCSRCKHICYCTRNCQKSDWEDHKLECQSLVRTKHRGPPTPLARLIARISWKLSRGDEGVAFNGRRFNDLMNHRENIEKDPVKADFYVSLSHVLFEFMGPECVPRPQEIMDIFGKIISNCFCITDWQMNSIGEGLYIGLSVHDHSCTPDANVIFSGSKAILRAPQHISGLKYSPSLLIRYVPLMQTTPERRKQLKEQYYFECTCDLCKDKDRDRVARSVRCNRCPSGVCPVDESFVQLICSSCSQISPIDVDEAIQYNLQVAWQIERLNDIIKRNDDKEDWNQALNEAVKVYDMFCTKLSPLNMKMAHLVDQIQKLSVRINAVCVGARFSTLGMAAYNRYLSKGNPELTCHYLLSAVCSSLAEPPDPKAMELFNQAQEAAVSSHGLRTSLTAEIDLMMHQFKNRLVKAV
ncbi:hypothetical protein WR25_10403 [Diploscapter pachys]|uniref:MYND-type domain-containing protein n=1 Tax=Diploscapter pachys TaxID=2018661 RepID=A0A2A2J8R7_9BILA|nr:hypothetical protein WR25_10403 [Diploscapter pachys]